MKSRDGVRSTVAAVIANYNYERFIGDAVSSLLAQTVPFDEIIVVDDGSTDGSLAALKPFGAAIRVIEKVNGGQLSAALAGVAAVKSDYVYLLDSDDLADERLVETILPLLAVRPVKVQFQLHSMDEHGVPIDSIFPSFAAGYGQAEMIRDNELLGFYVCPPTSGNVIRTDYLRRVAQADITLREAYDGVPTQAAPYFGAVVSINRPLARYRVHGSSDSQWGRPTPTLLGSELDRYHRRWREVDALLAAEGQKPQSPEKSVFVREREIMTAVLEGRRPRVGAVVGYIHQTLRSGLSRSQRIALSAWAGSLFVLPNSRASDLVVSRRSSAKRGKLLTAVARLTRSSTAVS